MAKKGYKQTEEHKRHISESLKGRIAWNKNKPCSEETKKKVSESLKGKIGPNSRAWKGNDVGYTALHMWINKNYPKKGICSWCGKKGYTEYANISGEYKRDINDFVELCVPCHRILDRK